MNKLLLLALFALLLTSPQAQAYFDPGPGSLFIQAIIAVVGGCFIFFKEIRHKIAAIFPGRSKGSG